MAIIKELVELMAGTIKLESQLGQGSYFEIFLPLKPIDFQQSQLIKTKSEEIPDLSGKTIIVAEDNSINQVIIQTILDPTKATIYIAANGQEAISLNQQHQAHLILMDIQMPVMNGIDAFKHIQKETPTTPIIALTANVMKSDVDNYLKLGFQSYIAKPIDIQLLYQSLTTAIT